MGYFSELAIEDHWEEREPSYPSRRETLQYFLEDLEAKLDELDAERPHDPMDPYYDRYFYSDCIIHYYENILDAKLYPEFADDPSNIIFLPKEIHFKLVHQGNFTNPSNWDEVVKLMPQFADQVADMLKLVS